jgi:hypothetical protein
VCLSLSLCFSSHPAGKHLERLMKGFGKKGLD